MLGCFVTALSVPRYAPAERSYALGPVRLGTSLLHFQRAAGARVGSRKADRAGRRLASRILVVQLRPLVELLLAKENIFWNIVFFRNILFF
jgi:hypothetical protein